MLTARRAPAVTYLRLVEHHLFGGEVGHGAEAAAVGESAGAQSAEDRGAEACGSASGYYMHDSGPGHAFVSPNGEKKRKRRRAPVKCGAGSDPASSAARLTHVDSRYRRINGPVWQRLCAHVMGALPPG